MIYYITPYFISLITLFFHRFNQKYYRLIFLIFLTPSFFIAIFRGLTGIDTPTYLRIIENLSIDDFQEKYSTEPGFYLLSYSINYFTKNNVITLSIITALFCSIFYFAFSKNKRSIFICCSLIFPYFFFDMSMNGIRYGFSFCLAVIALNNRENKYFIPFVISSLLFHSSSIFIFLFLEFSKKIKGNFLKIALFSIFALSFFALNIDYLSEKFGQYLNYSTPNESSGISSVITTLLISFIYLTFIRNNNLLVILLLVTTAFGYIVSQYSYAGLRILNIINFIAMISIIYNTDENTKYSFLLNTSLISTGLICFSFKMRNFLNPGDSEAPFIPYLFMWS